MRDCIITCAHIIFPYEHDILGFGVDSGSVGVQVVCMSAYLVIRVSLSHLDGLRGDRGTGIEVYYGHAID